MDAVLWIIACVLLFQSGWSSRGHWDQIKRLKKEKEAISE